MNEQWQELKETIVEMRDNNGTGTQQEVCKFLVNLMNILEKQMQEPKTEQYEKHTDHTDCIWYGNDSGCPVTCSQYRDGWNDAMDYIFKNGKGYQPYRHDS